MKQVALLIVIACSTLLACKKAVVPVPVAQPIDSTAQLVYRGQLMNGPYGNVMGVTKIYKQLNQYSLELDSFSVNSGPDLHVYLSKEVQPVNFIDLGNLRATGGRQVYNVAGVPDFSTYRYALIHCQQFDHLFGSTILQ